MLGISIYPQKEELQKILDYIDLAAKYHFQRIFTCLLSATGSKEKVFNYFKKIIWHARKKGFEIIIDTNPTIFSKYEVTTNDLNFFSDLGVTGIRLDEGFGGAKEAAMTYNPYDLDIEINLSHGGMLIDQILSYAPKKKKLTACHNFYPMQFTGLSYDYFYNTTKHFKDLNIRTASFVSSNAADHGPWKTVDQGICTLEMHRDLPIETQVKHLLMLQLVDDIIIGNAFASEQELKTIAKLTTQVPTFKIKVAKDITPQEETILFQETHRYRGDLCDNFIRFSDTRFKYAHVSIPNKHGPKLHQFGEVYIPNDDFNEYKGEVLIIKKTYKDPTTRKNLVAKVVDHELFLLNCLPPNSLYQFEKDHD